MLSRYNPVDIEASLRAVSPPPPFPPASDRAAWSEMAETAGKATVEHIIAAAEADAKTAIPNLPATLWLEFLRAGQREGFQEPRGKRRQMLANLALAECFEHKGRFLDPLMDVVWAICEESSWVLPAHQRVLTDVDYPVIDLGSATTSLELAEVDSLIGVELDPLVGKRIRYEVNHRSFEPYLARHDHWWLYNTQARMVNNWTAVCNAGVVGAALYLERDLARLAAMIARAARSLDDYLATFDSDGGSTEGPGYWSYGFGNFTVIAHLVEQRTNGLVTFLREDIVRKAAQFPLRTSLSPNTYVNFSDCDATISFIPGHLAFLSRQLDLPDLMRLARAQSSRGRRGNEMTWGLRNICWQPSAEPSGLVRASRHDWFGEMQWMIARLNPEDPAALVLAAKGGHNQEMHNQNDVGNVIVHVKGESIIPDIGRGRYTKAYFGPERYAHLVNSSRGHSVPVVNGLEQLPGQQYAAQVVQHSADDESDRLTIEMKDAYPKEAHLTSLQRTVVLHRATSGGWVELADHVVFATPGQMESVLTTFGAVEIAADSVTLRGKKASVCVHFDPTVVSASLRVEKDVDLAIGAADVNLVAFTLHKPTSEATVRLRIESL